MQMVLATEAPFFGITAFGTAHGSGFYAFAFTR
jgi:hypothetical protein